MGSEMCIRDRLGERSNTPAMSVVMSERGRCEASLKIFVSKLKGVTKQRPECPELTLAQIFWLVKVFTIAI